MIGPAYGAALASLFAAMAFSSTVASEDLAVCGAVAGQAFYGHKGIVKEAAAGWSEDRISAGHFRLRRDSSGKFDVVITDATGASFSSRTEGGIVVANRMSPDDAAIVVAYPGNSVEIYQFFRDAIGAQRMILLQSKGDPIHITNGSVMTGTCEMLRLPAE